ncbi:hypothetical protein [Lutibacter sp.]|uniref:hypothetical protein n=1 Tax=Lutibacter sp. TaxID=1925666 RepID=UPI0025C626BF|nr:hypothetical protein [Lutibacter sp.]MCF6180594.1 hypothetical protein [Lutibacter sp.]
MLYSKFFSLNKSFVHNRKYSNFNTPLTIQATEISSILESTNIPFLADFIVPEILKELLVLSLHPVAATNSKKIIAILVKVSFNRF